MFFFTNNRRIVDRPRVAESLYDENNSDKNKYQTHSLEIKGKISVFFLRNIMQRQLLVSIASKDEVKNDSEWCSFYEDMFRTCHNFEDLKSHPSFNDPLRQNLLAMMGVSQMAEYCLEFATELGLLETGKKVFQELCDCDNQSDADGKSDYGSAIERMNQILINSLEMNHPCSSNEIYLLIVMAITREYPQHILLSPEKKAFLHTKLNFIEQNNQSKVRQEIAKSLYCRALDVYKQEKSKEGVQSFHTAIHGMQKAKIAYDACGEAERFKQALCRSSLASFLRDNGQTKEAVDMLNEALQWIAPLLAINSSDPSALDLKQKAEKKLSDLLETMAPTKESAHSLNL